MKSAILSLLLVLPLFAWGVDGQVDLALPSFASGYSLELNGDEIKGMVRLNHIPSSIRLKKVDGSWQGRFGKLNIKSQPPVKVNGKIEVEISLLPNGVSVFNVSEDSKKKVFNIAGDLPSGDQSVGKLAKTGNELQVSTSSSSLKLKYDPKSGYNGDMKITTTGGKVISSSASMVVSGKLIPGRLMIEDPALYLLMYVVPFN